MRNRIALSKHMPHQVDLVNVVVHEADVGVVVLFAHRGIGRIPLHLRGGGIGTDQIIEPAGNPVARWHQQTHILHLAQFAGLLEAIDLNLGRHGGRVAPFMVTNHVEGAAGGNGLDNFLSHLNRAGDRLLGKDRDL